MGDEISPGQLLVRLTIWFSVLIGGTIALVVNFPESVRWLPLSGSDALEIAQGDLRSIVDSLQNDIDGIALEAPPPAAPRAGLARETLLIIAYLALSLSLTIVVMLPITWTYMATRREGGYRKSFVRALIVLPVCATTIVLLIQNSLSLAFGLAALVTAVRFRVALQDPIDGIYIFAAICVALAAGIGYLGIATIMAAFFCFASTFLWACDYGRNPLDDKLAAREQAKLERPLNRD